MWPEYLPSQYRAMAPRHEVDSMGYRRLVIGGQTMARVPAIPFPQGHPADIDTEGARLGSDPVARLAAMDAQGVDVHVIYPTTGLSFGGVQNVELLVALCRAYNNWARDFCSVAPYRLLAPAIVPQIDVFETLKETRRAVEDLGLAGVWMRPNPIGRTIGDPAWEILWSLLDELDAPLGIHEGTALCVPELGADRTDDYSFQHAMSHPFEHMAALLAFTAGGILDRHPGMRVLFLEAGCGWVPYWLERIDQHMTEAWAHRDTRLSLTATEFFRRQCYVAMQSEEGAVVPAFVSCLGADNLCWSTDFPHGDHEWRGMARAFAERTDLSGEAKEKIIGANAARAYKL
jgi:predicted TIM-barrel fold metal-dependent hydrolase